MRCTWHLPYAATPPETKAHHRRHHLGREQAAVGEQGGMPTQVLVEHQGQHQPGKERQHHHQPARLTAKVPV